MTLDDVERKHLTDLARDLISIPSYAPDDDKIYRFITEYLKKEGVETFTSTIDNPLDQNRRLFNVYSRYGSGKGPRIMINCHLDTVGPTDGWFHPPFDAIEDHGRIFGLGAADMKGGCAAAIRSYILLTRQMPDLKGELFLSLVYGEESPNPLGTDTLLKEFDLNGHDLIIVTEPSPLLSINDHCIVHKKVHRTSFPVCIVGAEGRALFEIEFFGKAAHASHPSQGINALHDAARVITELTRFDLYSNIKMGRGHYVILNIDGGGQSFTVPSRCRIFVNRQLTLGEDDRTVLKEVNNIIRSLKIRSRYSIRKRYSPSPDLEYRPYVNDRGPYINMFKAMMPERSVGRSAEKRCLFTTSSVGDFNLFGTRTRAPVLVFGPGGGNIHAPNEYVNVDDIVKTTEYLAAFLMKVYGKR